MQHKNKSTAGILDWIQSVSTNAPHMNKCSSEGERRCNDGTCIARVELCLEDQQMNQNTILIMMVVGLSVIVFLVILYIQHKQQRTGHRLGIGSDGALSDVSNNISLYALPPEYDEAIDSSLYPPTPQQRQLHMTNVTESSAPMTPPPNYDTALILLARSAECLLDKSNHLSERRCFSLEQLQKSQNRQNVDQERNSSRKNKDHVTKNIFRFSGQCYKNSALNDEQRALYQDYVPSPPPYPQHSPMYPLSPPSPLTPVDVHDTQTFEPNVVIINEPINNQDNVCDIASSWDKSTFKHSGQL